MCYHCVAPLKGLSINMIHFTSVCVLSVTQMAPGDILEGVCCGEERRKGGVGGCFPTIGGCSFALVGV